MSDEWEVEILIVEDDPNDAELIMRVLKKHNLANRIILLKDGAEALEFLFGPNGCGREGSGTCPRVVFLDLKLPKINGIEVLRRIKGDERTREIPVVILTASKEDRDLEAAYKEGANSYVTKPVKFDDFSEVVSRMGMYWLLMNKCPTR